MKKQLAFVMVPALAVAMVIGGAAQRDLISPASGGLGGGGALPTGENIVFDNSVNLQDFIVNGTDAEWGDGATLEGTNRVVTHIILPIHSFAGGGASCDVTVRIFDGGDDPTANDPGPMLWQSDTVSGFDFSPGLAQYSFPVPNIVVSDTMTWTLQLANCSKPEDIGSRVITPPTTGTSENFLWRHIAGDTWEAVTFDFGGHNSDLGSIIIAVPACTCSAPPPVLCGDANCDGLVNTFDIDPFIMALVDPVGWQQQYPDCNILLLDFNRDGMVNALDISGFLAALFGGCP